MLTLFIFFMEMFLWRKAYLNLNMGNQSSGLLIFIFFLKNLFGLLALHCVLRALSCGVWDLGIKPWPPALEAQSLIHQTIREISGLFQMKHDQRVWLPPCLPSSWRSRRCSIKLTWNTNEFIQTPLEQDGGEWNSSSGYVTNRADCKL